MSLETDLLVDRRRLKRRLIVWRVVGILALVAVAGLGFGRVSTGVSGPYVARLRVEGIITSDHGLVQRVRDAATDSSVRALIVAIDSPGGSVAGGESLYRAIAAVAAAKPVVAVMGGTAASAGYMVAMPAARVFASNATLTGSIGVLLPTGEVSGLLDKLGVSAETITSGPLKDQPSLTRKLTDQGREVLRGIVMDLYEQFVSMVADGRHMTVDQVHQLADGRAYTGRQALALGLIDEIGAEPEARAWLASARQIPAGLPARDLRQPGWRQRLFGTQPGGLLGGLLGLAFKSLSPQYVSLDGAWAIWQP